MLSLCSRRLLLFVATLFLYKKSSAQQTDTLTLHFGYNQSVLRADAISAIDGYFLAGKKKFTPQLVALSGYCDNIGKTRYNDSLSLARVISVKQYLCTHSIDSSLISSEQGFGENFPLNDNSTDALRAANRRVRIIIVRETAIDNANHIEQPGTTDTVFRTHKATDPQSRSISLAEMIMDTATKIGSKIILENIIFYGGRHLPMAASIPVMDNLLQVMQANEALQIEIDGYVCCEPDGQDGTDSDTGRKDLSVQRAKYIYTYLQKNGIPRNRMSYAGFGASHKLYPEEKNYKEQTLNRRVEIKIINK